MPHSPPTLRWAGRRRSSLAGHLRRVPRRRRAALDEARAAARFSRDVRERLWAGSLETLVAFIPAAAAVAFSIDAERTRRPEMAYVTTGARDELDTLVTRLARLDPIDPFSVRRAEATGAKVLSVADAGGPEKVARTRYGRHLMRDGLRTPLFAYLWRDGRIAAGVALVRTADAPDFDADAARLLAHMQPLLEDALLGPIDAGALDREAPPASA